MFSYKLCRIVLTLIYVLFITWLTLIGYYSYEKSTLNKEIIIMIIAIIKKNNRNYIQYIFTVDIRNNNNNNNSNNNSNNNNNNNRNNKSNGRNYLLYIFTRDRKQIIFFASDQIKKKISAEPGYKTS